MDSVGLYTDAAVYDILHAPGTAEDVDVLSSLRSRYAGGTPDVWLEPACGSGRYLRVAAGRGSETIGFDLEPGMIEYAQSRAERAGVAERSRYFVGDMRSFDRRVGRASVGLAFNLINTVRHLESDDEMHRHFAAVDRVLAPGGVYVVGISLTVYGLEPPSEDVWEGARGRCHVSQVVQYLPPTGADGDRMESVYSHLTITRPRGEEHRPSHYALRAYDLAEWRGLIDGSALRVIDVVEQDGEPCEATAPGYALWVLGSREDSD
ncbi:MAG: class I SAM-dependent methyltransferase [Planctomycetota bacterium]